MNEAEQKAEQIFDAAIDEEDLKRLIAAALREAHHCKDCCCSRSWRALGILDSKGMSIPEHIDELRAEIAKLKAENEEWLRMAKRKDQIIDSQIKEIAKLRAERDAEFVRGLLRANELATKFWHDCDNFDRAIQAEIDKGRV